MTVAGLVLAAGEGSRLGRPKALVRFEDQLLVERAAATLRAAGCFPVLVVLGAAASEVARSADLRDAVVVVNDGWATGMGSSLCTGLTALSDLRAPAAVVLLVDQPHVSPDLVRRLVSHHSPGTAAVSASYGGRRRNPVLLDASVWPEVTAAAVGDIGARGWLDTHADRVALVACDDLGSDLDIDTPADLERLTHDTAKDSA
ncbi:MAG TPA: nucleotidyltransferase family protein [Mycobacteriales bacterium]|jgi:CTP:molybdopterin cytidylyltransferase MocA|nr:nucleotidyltransferase family protein [Mycobacteriales bacterium]